MKTVSNLLPLSGGDRSFRNSLFVQERAVSYLALMPPAISGSNGHNATFAAACALVNGFAFDACTSLRLLLLHYNPRCLPRWTEDDLRHKVSSAFSSTSLRGRGYLLNVREAALLNVRQAPERFRWPSADPLRISASIKEGLTAAELIARSPGPLDGEDPEACSAAFLRTLFAAKNDPLLCVGKSARQFATRPLSKWLFSGRLAEFSLIVPAYMTAKRGITKAGKESEHTLENTGPRRFVVVEFDSGTSDEHAARLWHLAGFAPLAVVVHSGGRSLHGWYYCRGVGEADQRKFMRYASSIGADPALFRNPSQFVRLPGGKRENGCRQRVFYWNPSALSPLNEGKTV